MGNTNVNTTPATEIEELAAKDQKHVWHHLTQHKGFETTTPMMMVSGEGLRITDDKGNEYLDAVAGAVWTVNVGYGRERIAKAVYEQIKTMNFFAGSMGSAPGAQFAEMLIDKMPGMNRVYYSNSGSEANEKAFKMVRQISHNKYNGKKHKILFRERDYHGTTITALSATGQLQRKDQYGPFTPGFVEFPHCCEYRSQFEETTDYGVKAALEMEKVILAEGPDTVGAVIVEPITAGGGVITPPAGYYEKIQELCKKYNLLLIVDEVVCGLGRTGTWFGYQHFGIKPDIVTMAKGVASGYAAISCTVTTEEVFNMFKEDPSDNMSYFRDISTFGGCTAGPAAAIENMKIIEEEHLLENVTKMGEYAMDRMLALKEKHAMIGDVRGKGLFLGIELVKDRETKEPMDESVSVAIAADCMKNGVIIGRTNRSFATLNNTLCLAPALIATKDDIDEIMDAIDAAITRLN
ncbi:aminotransferase class III-fold pyridoxal phosphate-dependent enzyme [Cocleimonas sp. KMM 6892]|uniref:aminotransferase family protein n=1 Tax=unclassified Cocleimonas TaxID=2639732 RepID=UPI002DBAF5B8|nr:MULTISPECIES: aminotransferase class III-fold pyridoxal phosphate-dependent enzyme [unclassified Cocleimonas]MEB8431974.1 aminotransferase class III-fold pyridoxal phosphate-dependent enzyme [Cocleimonas sp. KMM 6892]MEC4714940.1 aminotransferase class III-fold pyridoxal phosphate-dependent enzyme [Cocleimonas sp. KMM 6895]MEC4744246.1 aminotransferase class III-fold pyridoxal phosphate-dependent enzyme [Cocleimonas sp. KMM 6896]